MARFDVTTLGEVMLRYSVPPGKRLAQASQLDVCAAGAEANVAGLLARLGWRCGWVSSLPDNPLGHRAAAELGLAGLDLSAVVWSDRFRMATFYIEFAAPPRTTQVIYDRANSCFANLQPEQVDWDYLLDTHLLHLSGLTVPLSPAAQEIVFEAVRRAKAQRIPVSFDVNYRANLWPPETAAAALAPLMRQVDLLFCGRSDARRLFGFNGAPRDIVLELARLSDAAYIVTSLSQDGLIGWDRDRFYMQPARQVEILDRIGAGDAMVAGVLHGWLQGDFVKGLRYGALTAALALSQYGDQVMTTRQEVEELLAHAAGDISR